jgi:hypothetical protein
MLPYANEPSESIGSTESSSTSSSADLLVLRSLPSRVTRLGERGEFSQSFCLGSWAKISKVAQHLVATFFQSIDNVLTLTKNGFGYIFGHFFHKLIWSPYCQGNFDENSDCLPWFVCW